MTARAFNDFAAIPRGQYGVIYADPAWYFKTWGAKGTGRGAFSHYNLMSDDELRVLPVGDLAAKNCMLFLWVPNPMRQLGMELISLWGFRYATVGFTWVKPCIGKPSAEVVAKWGAATQSRGPRNMSPQSWRPGFQASRVAMRSLT
jgi:N6-adenosine-specific RNA methylase IME4